MTRALLLLSSLACACTFDDGEGFATLRSATLNVVFEPGAARDLGDGSLLNDLGYRVTLTSSTLNVELARLEERLGDAAATAFDPANPPAGYSLCHSGHCHADDGRLISYEEIEAELAAGNARFEVTVALPIDRGLSLLEDPVVALTRVEPSRELPQAELARASLVLDSLTLQGLVSGGPAGGGLGDSAVPYDIRLTPLGAVFAALDFAVDRDAPESIALDLTLSVRGTLFDSVDFAPLASGAAIELGDPDDPAVVRLVQNLLASPFAARLTHPENAP